MGERLRAPLSTGESLASPLVILEQSESDLSASPICVFNVFLGNYKCPANEETTVEAR
jgi:hypothetical protein